MVKITACKCAKVTDQYHGWECDVTGGACVFLIPNSKQCAEQFGEGPDVVDKEIELTKCIDCKHCKFIPPEEEGYQGYYYCVDCSESIGDEVQAKEENDCEAFLKAR